VLDTTTKRRIDTARDILVGKVPDPKSQVEQITIALIYKFMDDMDAEAEELGGKRKFFTGDYARYGWAKLMAPSLGGHEMLGLYGEGIAKMPENPGIPPLFRDIFKNAYLPYRDPETLKAFLKIIDEFSYDHSERLGDAFEYLLSVLGSQGDAGQFRTPRHIIDFMVEVLAPQKNETILDPACGTAGFLISAYKHILRANTDAKGHSTLTPDDKGRLAKNFKGYDISPDMVRLSLVNLYLHGFSDPHIFEYDTLTSEERWNEFADVILANPPFMSPKGGIKPHKRFSIQAKRSEVLFVDYMAEHLTPTGRAGIIVPEGIIFQSQTAYKELRKMLVDNSLVAVVSLPAGCFNPYSGVKTSILILDKSLAHQSNTIAFFKVENDGFGLGAQRRAIEKNDLPQVQAELAAYLQALRSQQATADLKPTCGLIVPKEKIAANGDYNLSSERYREGAAQSTHFPWRTIESLVETITPPAKIQKTAFGKVGRFPIIDQSQDAIAGWTDDESTLVRPSKSLVIFGDHTCAIKLVEAPFAQGADGIKILQTIDTLDPRFLFHVLRARPLESDGYQRHYSKLKEHQIPLPPLEVQKEIVVEIEGYQKVINGARAVLDHYRPHIPIHSDWPMVELGKVCTIKSGGTPDRSNEAYWNGDIPWVTTTLIDYGVIDRANEFITSEGLKNSATWVVPKGTVLMAMYGQGVTRGRVAILGIDAAVNQACAVFQLKDDSLDNGYLFLVLQSRYEDLRKVSDARGGNQSNLSAQVLKEYLIPLPPLATQQAIVAEIEAEQALVAANRELNTRFERKIQTTLARIWGEEISLIETVEGRT
jgi:type I restriction enzyme M protein